jgi:hypothetical protein
MGKKEKYYNFIVDDLMSKVHVGHPDADDLYVDPYGVNDIYVGGVAIDYRGFASSTLTSIFHEWNSDLRHYLIVKYGMHDDENELNTVWFKLRRRVREEILIPSENGDWWVNH